MEVFTIHTTAIWCVEYLIIYYKKGCLSEKEHVLYLYALVFLPPDDVPHRFNIEPCWASGQLSF
jgi:hypothetical protein